MGYARNRLLVVFPLILLLLLLVAGVAGADSMENPGDDSLPVVKLSPQIREQDRDRQYYQALDCRELGQADARSDAEKRWLGERKAACLERYRAFSPRSFQQ
ncbi:MAG TPA: hypothetical protein DIW43_00820 [Spongiibacteraceae bacterium]|nr:hypothetical protein [Spongiibacteraceae bacterium]HCS25963.1 hypothetical protein [Spongiibacteraceae bacterium]|tara:strand:- start:902 stop:1207 length:306 start_codon:yes stop_codon:yes gene_type:complete